jgi:hypothetical protein
MKAADTYMATDYKAASADRHISISATAISKPHLLRAELQTVDAGIDTTTF